MKTWSSNQVSKTIQQLREDCGKSVPFFVQVINEDGSEIYPVYSLSSNKNCIMISVYANEGKPFERIKELNNESGSIERVRL